MRKSLILTVTLAAVTVLIPEAGGAPARGGIGAELVAGSLDWPSGFTFTPDGRIFYGERFTGEIRIRNLETGSDTLFATIPDVSTAGERGLLGVAIHPDYPTVPLVFAYATRIVDGQPRNQIIGMRDSGGIGTNPRIIFSSDTRAATIHNGGRILFGPDGRLYAIVGDAAREANSQDPDTDTGKILRMTARGSVPPDNPFPGNLAFAFGIRNSYGFTFDPVTGLLWETENGPECNDEINIVRKGRNYGWGPSQTCSSPPPPPENTNQDGPNPQMPLTFYTPVVAPVGIAFCDGCSLGATEEGNGFYGRYNNRQIRRIVLTPDRVDIESEDTAYTSSRPPLSIEVAPDGRIYFSVDNGIWRLIQT
jgi:aldose sugar dehydrogenase